MPIQQKQDYVAIIRDTGYFESDAYPGQSLEKLERWGQFHGTLSAADSVSTNDGAVSNYVYHAQSLGYFSQKLSSSVMQLGLHYAF